MAMRKNEKQHVILEDEDGPDGGILIDMEFGETLPPLRDIQTEQYEMPVSYTDEQVLYFIATLIAVFSDQGGGDASRLTRDATNFMSTYNRYLVRASRTYQDCVPETMLPILNAKCLFIEEPNGVPTDLSCDAIEGTETFLKTYLNHDVPASEYERVAYDYEKRYTQMPVGDAKAVVGGLWTLARATRGVLRDTRKAIPIYLPKNTETNVCGFFYKTQDRVEPYIRFDLEEYVKTLESLKTQDAIVIVDGITGAVTQGKVTAVQSDLLQVSRTATKEQISVTKTKLWDNAVWIYRPDAQTTTYYHRMICSAMNVFVTCSGKVKHPHIVHELGYPSPKFEDDFVQSVAGLLRAIVPTKHEILQHAKLLRPGVAAYRNVQEMLSDLQRYDVRYVLDAEDADTYISDNLSGGGAKEDDDARKAIVPSRSISPLYDNVLIDEVAKLTGLEKSKFPINDLAITWHYFVSGADKGYMLLLWLVRQAMVRLGSDTDASSTKKRLDELQKIQGTKEDTKECKEPLKAKKTYESRLELEHDNGVVLPNVQEGDLATLQEDPDQPPTVFRRAKQFWMLDPLASMQRCWSSSASSDIVASSACLFDRVKYLCRSRDAIVHANKLSQSKDALTLLQRTADFVEHRKQLQDDLLLSIQAIQRRTDMRRRYATPHADVETPKQSYLGFVGDASQLEEQKLQFTFNDLVAMRVADADEGGMTTSLVFDPLLNAFYAGFPFEVPILVWTTLNAFAMSLTADFETREARFLKRLEVAKKSSSSDEGRAAITRQQESDWREKVSISQKTNAVLLAARSVILIQSNLRAVARINSTLANPFLLQGPPVNERSQPNLQSEMALHLVAAFPKLFSTSDMVAVVLKAAIEKMMEREPKLQDDLDTARREYVFSASSYAAPWPSYRPFLSTTTAGKNANSTNAAVLTKIYAVPTESLRLDLKSSARAPQDTKSQSSAEVTLNPSSTAFEAQRPKRPFADSVIEAAIAIEQSATDRKVDLIDVSPKGQKEAVADTLSPEEAQDTLFVALSKFASARARGALADGERDAFAQKWRRTGGSPDDDIIISLSNPFVRSGSGSGSGSVAVQWPGFVHRKSVLQTFIRGEFMTLIGRAMSRSTKKTKTTGMIRNLIPAYLSAVDAFAAASASAAESGVKDYQFVIVMLASVVLHVCDMLEKDGFQILKAALESLATYVSDNDYTLAELNNAFNQARENEKNQKMEAKQKYMELMGITSIEFKEMMDANLLSWKEATTVTGTSKRNGTSATPTSTDAFDNGQNPAAPKLQQIKDDVYDTGDNEDSL